ncbi:DUF2252 domain-containing protein [Cellulomonas sp. URHD0024]|uniref:DUF2252 domain-containing protein n=1 Tax=Cellulomonas sp. URHD0024 TaxID=1302620 RepID=UPI001E481E11|nr:DUF2252 domain-containing protein [Cellulomonas sp. URHD0024]
MSAIQEPQPVDAGAVRPAAPLQATRRRAADHVEHLTREERRARGAAARVLTPRSALALAGGGDKRPDPIDLLMGQGRVRVPELVPLRYGRMALSAFAFYRGAALIMASDLASTPNSGLEVQLCGDAHMSNFGLYGTPERRLLFDLNDFDETLPGPFEWDVKRLVASIEIAARGNGVARKDRRQIVVGAARAYREAMRDFATKTELDVWYARVDVDTFMGEYASQFTKTQAKRTQSMIAKARSRDHLQSVGKLTTVVGGRRRLISDPPLVTTLDELLGPLGARDFAERLAELVRSYRSTLQPDRRHLLEQYHVVDMARKVVGVGSVGTRAWILLLQGIDEDDLLILQAKEAQASVLEQFLGASEYTQAGQRVVEGQRLMQAASDAMLGWQRTHGIDGVERDFYLRQLRDWKGSADIESMQPQGMARYSELCAWTLARAHARSGDRVAIAAYLGTSKTADEAFATFAAEYADRTEGDHALLLDAIASGRVQATTGV